MIDSSMDYGIMDCGRIRPVDVFSTTDPRGAVRIRMGTEGVAESTPLTIPNLLQGIVNRFPDNRALARKNTTTGNWEFVTYKEYQAKVHHTAKAFIKLGLEARHSVGVLAFNCPEWFYAEMGSIHAGGIIAGIYTTNSPEAVHHVLTDSNANIVVVDDTKQMDKIRQIKDRLPKLKAAIQLNGPFTGDFSPETGYYKWSDIEEMQLDDINDSLQHRLNDIFVNECCCLIYTSGTVGLPKGVMLSHDNLTWECKAAWTPMCDVRIGEEVLVSYLPLSHSAAQTADVFMTLFAAGTVYFADRNALKGSLINTLKESRPTRFAGVPRVFEKIHESFVSAEANMSRLQKILLNWARANAIQYHQNCKEGKCHESWQYKMAKYFVFSKIKANIGFDNCKLLFSGAAPISNDVKEFFLSLDMPLFEAYGLSETAAGHCFGGSEAPDFQTVGKALPGAENKIFKPDSEGNGELCLRGRHIFMGYINNAEKTKEALDDEGWLHTGDLGRISEDGYIYITGRIKELIITAGGENIPPVLIESTVKSELPGLSNTVLIGDRRKFLTMLVTIKTKMNVETGSPLDTLQTESLDWMTSLGLPYKTLSEILDAGPCPKVLQSIQEGIDRANKQAISNAQRIQKFALLPHDFSIATGELGPTLKLKRHVVNEMYMDIIESLYNVA